MPVPLRYLTFALVLCAASIRMDAQGVQRDTVRVEGLVAHVHRPAGVARAPAIMLVGGSGGGIGWQDYMGALLAERGFVAMSVAYFAMDGLPKELERIPLEYFDRALRWLSTQSFVDATRIGVGGVSKGGELSLLLASMHPELKAVAVFSPSGLVFQSIAPGFPKTSSWTVDGRDVPFIPYGSVEKPASTAEIYLAGVKGASPAELEAASVKVERIRGPILMLAGRNDKLWASSTLSDMVAARLREKRFAFPVENIGYDDAGHLISSIREDDVTRMGGTKDGNSFAQRDGQRRFLEFFSKVFAR